MQAAIQDRGIKGVVGAVLAGVGAAACLNIATTSGNFFLTMLAYISPVCIFMAGLGGGISASVISAVVAMLVMSMFGKSAVVLIFGFTLIIPAALLSIMALRYRRGVDGEIYWYPTGYLFMALVFYVLAAFGASVVYTSGIEGGMHGFIAERLDQMIEIVTKAQEANPPLEGAEEMRQLEAEAMPAAARFFKQYLPALFMICVVAMLMVSGIVAQISLKSVDWALRSEFSFQDFILPHWLLALVAGSFGLIFLQNETVSFVGRNVFPVLLMPFFVLGVAVVHIWAATRKNKIMWLVLFYIVLSLGSPAILVTGLGLIEQFFNIRQRFNKPVAPTSN